MIEGYEGGEDVFYDAQQGDVLYDTQQGSLVYTSPLGNALSVIEGGGTAASLSTSLGGVIGSYYGGPLGGAVGAEIGPTVWDSVVNTSQTINGALNYAVGANVFPLFGNLGATYSDGSPILPAYPVEQLAQIEQLPPPQYSQIQEDICGVEKVSCDPVVAPSSLVCPSCPMCPACPACPRCPSYSIYKPAYSC